MLAAKDSPNRHKACEQRFLQAMQIPKHRSNATQLETQRQEAGLNWELAATTRYVTGIVSYIFPRTLAWDARS